MVKQNPRVWLNTTQKKIVLHWSYDGLLQLITTLGWHQQEPFLFVVDPAGTIMNFPRVSTNISPYTITVAINDNGSVFPTDSKQTILLTILIPFGCSPN